MLDLSNIFKRKNILIYGFGITGKACFEYLKKKNNVLVFDDNKKKIPNKFNKFIYKKSKKKYYKNFDFIVLSPGVNKRKCSLNKILKKNNNKIITDLDIFYLSNINNKKTTITGTNGKSTTAKLLYEVLKEHAKDVRLIGNIGKPVLSEKNIKKNTEFVIEASSYQIEYSKFFKTDNAMILNISPDHLERHGNFSRYVDAKLKLISQQDNNCFAYIEKKNKYLKNKLKILKPKSKIFYVNLNNIFKLEKKIDNPYFKNVNNLCNLSFLIDFGKQNKLKLSKIYKTVNSFAGLKYRQEIIFKKRGLTVINDSKSTSFSSSINLLKSYKNVFWLVGGIPKKGDKFNLESKYYKNINAYIFSKKKNFFKEKFRNKINFKLFSNLTKALKKIAIDIKINKIKNPTILFSPSAASFDSFQNFEARGEYFNRLLKKINFLKKIDGK